MSQHKLSVSTAEKPWEEKVTLDDVDISTAVNVVRYEVNPGGLPTVTLGIVALGGVELNASLAEVTVIDYGEALQLRQYLAEACDLCQQLLGLMSDQQIAEVLKTRDTSRQIRLWLMHTEGPDAQTSLRVYREKVRRANDGAA